MLDLAQALGLSADVAGAPGVPWWVPVPHSHPVADLVQASTLTRDGRGLERRGEGRAEEISRAQELLNTADLPLFPWHAAPKQRFVRIDAAEITGRRFRVVGREAWTTPWTEAPRSAPE